MLHLIKNGSSFRGLVDELGLLSSIFFAQVRTYCAPDTMRHGHAISNDTMMQAAGNALAGLLQQDLDWSLKTTLDQETEKVVGFEDDA